MDDMLLIYKAAYFFFVIMFFSISILCFLLRKYDGLGILFSMLASTLIFLGGLYWLYGDDNLLTEKSTDENETKQENQLEENELEQAFEENL